MKLEQSVSYSRNVFLPVTNLCQNNCAYCGFRRDPGDGSWFMSSKQVLDLVKKGRESGCSEALLTLGERPEIHEEAKEMLEEFDYQSTVDYLEDLCKQILEIGLLPHTNAGILDRRELRCLRCYNASMGLMLECATELSAHEKSPGKNPKLRLRMIEAAGELKIPFTTGLLVGIGESWQDRIKSLLEIRELQEKYGHIQEVIIQPFTPQPGTPMENTPPPTHLELLSTVRIARIIMPNMNIQVPPNLTSKLSDFLQAGANDLGGISTVTPDFINPGNPWPSPNELRTMIRNAGFEPRERLPIYPEFIERDDFMFPQIEAMAKDLADEDGYRKA